jgi:bifunctional diaminopimelate decarboxylase / aspartate kinase
MSGRWVVLKFGGTSVSTAACWSTIEARIKAVRAEGAKVLVVCSAIAGASDALEALLERAIDRPYDEQLSALRTAYAQLASELGVDGALVEGLFGDLDRLVLGASLIGERTPRLRARVLSAGELLLTRLGAAWLVERGVPAHWHDARLLLKAEHDAGAPAARRYLAARCGPQRDAGVEARLGESTVVVTQGFIASNAAGETVLLGRGGSDTSAALFAARLGAARCEVWTDVPGMFTANPAVVADARVLDELDYAEARELASTGAKVLHPGAVEPLMEHGIPLHIRCTREPDAPGTVVARMTSGGPRVAAISSRQGVALVSMDAASMWRTAGFLARVFGVFARRGISVDLVSTSETNVTVSLDPSDSGADAEAVAGLVAELSQHAEVRLLQGCASVSVVGRGIRRILHRLGPALSAFEERRVHLVSQSASDLNLTFVVDGAEAERLVRRLHQLLFPATAETTSKGTIEGQWWHAERAALLRVAAEGTPVYVYHRPTVRSAARALVGLAHVDRVFYAMKANANPGVLHILAEEGVGFECVSPGEVAMALEAVGGDASRVLFTPNFAGREEYAQALAQGVWTTLDDTYPLAHWPEVFAGRDILLRIDPGEGRGHHSHVRTGGAQSKFGIAADQLGEAARLAAAAGARVVGLHAHSGSGVLDPTNWRNTAGALLQALSLFEHVGRLDLGGGLGIPERPGQPPLDLARLDALLGEVKAARPNLELWLEPGRYLVAEAGVLLARVQQIKQKGSRTFVGVDAGMNSLLRPALYGAWHPIENLSRVDESPSLRADVVGPICETGDTLGSGRELAATDEGDILVIGNAGAYGRVMASSYNARPPAREGWIG